MTATYSKISKIKFRYGFTDLDEELEERYTDEDENQSFRDLERYINTRIIKTELKNAGYDPIAGEAENYLDILREQKGDLTSGDITDARNKLKSLGVDVEQIESDFVSYQTVGNYIKNTLDIDVETQTTPDVENARDTIRALVSRTRNVTRRSIERLNDAGLVNIGETIDVTISLNVTCRECGGTYEARDFIDIRKCNCYSDAPDLSSESEKETESVAA